jgi:hypothetical protein
MEENLSVYEYGKLIFSLCQKIGVRTEKNDPNNEEDLRKILCYLDLMKPVVLEEYSKYF